MGGGGGGGDRPPSNKGRERAIETLIDMEHRGSVFRTGRILDEALPSALLARPNLVNKSALVEMANSLARYEVTSFDLEDDEGKTATSRRSAAADEEAAAVAPPDGESSSAPSTPAPKPRTSSSSADDDDDDDDDADDDAAASAAAPSDEDKRERILRHHAKIVVAKNKAAAAGRSARSPLHPRHPRALPPFTSAPPPTSSTSTSRLAPPTSVASTLAAASAPSTTLSPFAPSAASSSSAAAAHRAASPPPKLVAALHRLYEDNGGSSSTPTRASSSSSSSGDRQEEIALLRSVLSHPAFSSVGGSSVLFGGSGGGGGGAPSSLFDEYDAPSSSGLVGGGGGGGLFGSESPSSSSFPSGGGPLRLGGVGTGSSSTPTTTTRANATSSLLDLYSSPTTTTTTTIAPGSGAAVVSTSLGIGGAGTSSSPSPSPSPSSSSATASTSAANMEAMIGNVCKLAGDDYKLSGLVRGIGGGGGGGEEEEEDDDDHREDRNNDLLHGLLISVLSVLTGCASTGEEDEPQRRGMESGVVGGYGGRPKSDYAAAVAAGGGGGGGGGGEASSSSASDSATASSSQLFVERPAPTLQVGAALSLLDDFCADPLSVDEGDRADADGDEEDGNVIIIRDETAVNLDDSLLRYFADAASTYEERIELQKVRLLAKLKADQEKKNESEEEEAEKTTTTTTTAVAEATAAAKERGGGGDASSPSSSSDQDNNNNNNATPIPNQDLEPGQRGPAYMVTIPQGVRGGQQFPVNVQGTRIMVTCPPNAEPGRRVRIVPPPTESSEDSAAAAAASTTATTTTTDGSSPAAPPTPASAAGGGDDATGTNGATGANGGGGEEEGAPAGQEAASAGGAVRGEDEEDDNDDDDTVEYEETHRAEAAAAAAASAAAAAEPGGDDDESDSSSSSSDDDDDDGMSSDSSGNEDPELDDDEEEEISDDELDEDDEDGLEDDDEVEDEDDEEAAMLQQALALSLAEHNAAMAAAEAEAEASQDEADESAAAGEGENTDRTTTSSSSTTATSAAPAPTAAGGANVEAASPPAGSAGGGSSSSPGVMEATNVAAAAAESSSSGADGGGLVSEEVENDVNNEARIDHAVAGVAGDAPPTATQTPSAAEDAVATTTTTTTPSPTTGGRSSDQQDHGDADDEESKLPPLPSPPASYPYLPLLRRSSAGTLTTALAADVNHEAPIIAHQEGTSSVGMHDVDEEKLARDVAESSAYLDPSSLSRFGALPATHVLVHLLRCAAGLVENYNDVDDDSDDDRSSKKKKKNGRTSSSRRSKKDKTKMKNKKSLRLLTRSACPGGVGAALFPPVPSRGGTATGRGVNGASSRDNATESTNAGYGNDAGDRGGGGGGGRSKINPDSITVQLLIATLQLLSNLRTESMSHLSHFVAKQEEEEEGIAVAIAMEDETSTREENIDEDDSPLPDEQDDPAFAAARGQQAYTSSSTTSEQDFESKGMMRKAAAAAQVASLRLESRQKKVDKWKSATHWLSLCCLWTVRCLRSFLRRLSGKRLSLLERGDGGSLAAGRPYVHLSPKSQARLSSLLSALTSPEASRSFGIVQDAYQRSSLSLRDSKGDSASLGELCLPLQLCNESMQLWGESLPLLYPTHKERTDLLRSLVQECCSSSGDRNDASGLGLLIRTVPWGDKEERTRKLDVLCNRLRRSDLLDDFVSRPTFFVPGVAREVDALVESWAGRTGGVQDEPERLSSVLSLLSTVVKARQSGLSEREGDGSRKEDNLTMLYLALCHRANASLLLWDGLSLTSSDEVDSDGSGGLLSRSSSIAAGSDGALQLNPNSSAFQLDSTKCSDSIAIVTAGSNASGNSANQRASKVWGTVLSTTFFHPKTGVHRWAVRLDRCERGHVFVGVATARASVKTYVGGDKHGWGVIGTQALWHDRSKIRGDYGSTFRTGAIVVVTLDTDAGTLSFGLWKDASASSSEGSTHSETQTMNLSSPFPRSTPGGSSPTIEDWGVAFEGLPLDAKLFPAIGLYQRDDRVTLLGVTSNQGDTGPTMTIGGMTSGELYYPRPLVGGGETKHSFAKSAESRRVRDWNKAVSADGISFASEVLTKSIDLLSSQPTPSSIRSDTLLSQVLPSVASSICLIPSCVPFLSAQYAMELLPLVTQCARLIDGENMAELRQAPLGGKIKQGKWVIRATSSSGSGGNDGDVDGECEEYIVKLGSVEPSGEPSSLIAGFHGEGIGTTGRSKNGHVSIIGMARGTSLYFVEEWADGSETVGSSIDVASKDSSSDKSSSACVIEARLSLDGSKFEGTYRNVQYGTTGSIAGVHVAVEVDKTSPLTIHPSISLESNPKQKDAEWQEALLKTESILCLAVGHLSLMLSSHAAMRDVELSIDESLPDDFTDAGTEKKKKKRVEDMAQLLHSAPILASGINDPYGSQTKRAVTSVRKRCSCGEIGNSAGGAETRNRWQDAIFSPFLATGSPDSTRGHRFEITDTVDCHIAPKTGGLGSLSPLCPTEYAEARRRIISVMLHHSSLYSSVMDRHRNGEGDIDKTTLDVWRAALYTMENGIREAMSNSEKATSRKESCLEFCNLVLVTSDLLLQCPTPQTKRSVRSTIQEVQVIYKAFQSKEDVRLMKRQMDIVTEQGIMRCVGLRALEILLSPDEQKRGICTDAAFECAILSLPRLMGRGARSTGKGVQDEHVGLQLDAADDENETPDIGVYYLSNLHGCDVGVQSAIQSSVHSLYNQVGSVLSGVISRDSILADRPRLSSFATSSESVLFCLLANFLITFRSCDHKAIVMPSLGCLRTLLVRFRDSLLTEEDETSSSTGSDLPALVVSQLTNALHKHSSRKLLRTAISVVHVVCSQLARQVHNNAADGSSELVSASLGLLLNEMQETVPLVANETKSRKVREGQDAAEEEWDTWCETNPSNTGSRWTCNKRKESKSSDEWAGVAFLIEHGSLSSDGAANTPSTSAGAANTEYVSTQLISSGHYLSRLLSILYAVISSPAFLSSISLDVSKWVDFLLNAVGVCRADLSHVDSKALDTDDVTSHLPIRHRIRIFRLLRPILSSMDPDASVVQGLFHLACRGGKNILSEADHAVAAGDEDKALSQTAGTLGDTDAHTVVQETVSILRHLHSSAGKKTDAMTWRELIHTVMSKEFNNATRDIGAQRILSVRQNGILAFLGGVPGRIGNGSFVIIKPAAASAISSSASSSPSKSHSAPSTSASGGSTAVGSGTEGIVSGLCRNEALAGIISNIDLKAGVCEVILLNRSASFYLPSALRGEALGSSTGMTVRAVRASLADVVSADELPLLLDMGLPVDDVAINSFSLAVHQLLDARTTSDENLEPKGEQISAEADTKEEAKPPLASEEKKTESLDLISSIMALRSMTVLLSDKRLMTRYVKDASEEKRLCFSKLLDLASTNASSQSPSVVKEASNESLSALPLFEARFWHFRSMLTEVGQRRDAFDKIPSSHWDAVSMKESTLESGASASSPQKTSVGAGYSTPPATSGAVSGEGGAASAGGGGSRAEDESVSTADSQGQGQSANASSNNDEDDEAAAHLREAAIAQMAELGLPRSWSELALRRTGGTNIEAAVHFCLERGGDMERLLAEERERERRLMSSGSGRRRGLGGGSRAEASNLIKQLVEMGFPSHWCAEALAATRNNVDEALTWILINGERLSAQDEGDEEDEEADDDDDDDESGDEEEEEDAQAGNESQEGRSGEDGGQQDVGTQSETVETKEAEGEATASSEPAPKSGPDTSAKGWAGSVCPLRFVSGRSNINPSSLEISGLPSGGFSSVGTKGVLLTEGKWYYEAELLTAGCLQIGWADNSFAGHCQADRGDGCGDGPSSWAYDGWRRYRWHSTATEWGCRWTVGDVVGCLVDMDNKTVSFTLNGRAEEIGMGLAFSGEGFRPCGGVYACVSFNRREKLRLVLGGQGNEPFKYSPPDGYRGVGDAVLEAVKERDALLKDEGIIKMRSTLKASPGCDSSSTFKRKYICDFSDGEHGHELFAWQHRYYGSDASVHLGASRSGTRSSSGGARHKSSSSGSGAVKHHSSSNTTADDLSARLGKAFAKGKQPSTSPEEESNEEPIVDTSFVLTHIKRAYDEVISDIKSELEDICRALGILYSRKMVMHTMLTLSDDFSLDLFVMADAKVEKSALHLAMSETSRKLWRVLELCASLRAAGWVGEAGAMAVAAEALGLGISSHELSLSSTPAGMGSAGSRGDALYLPCGGITQMLSTVMKIDGTETASVWDFSTSLAACSEAALGGEGGGSLVFLRSALQSVAATSPDFRMVLVAAIRQSVRLLAVVEFAKDEASDPDGNSEDDDTENTSTPEDDADAGCAPDARLTSFLTGLLLSWPVRKALSEDDNRSILTHLFSAWSIGLLSASAPWRMVCALTVSAILNLCPQALSLTTKRVPILDRYFMRLESTVVRRIWAERAAVPICSKYVQAYIELLSSVKRSQRICQGDRASFSVDSIAVDAATPRPLGLLLESMDKNKESQIPLSHSSWEWDEGFINSDAGWEVWTGSVECMEVEWKKPSQSIVRTLMDGGEGPPFLREGCLVVRSRDWDGSGSGSVMGNEDGKDVYEKEKAEREKEKQLVEEKESGEAATQPEDSDPKEADDKDGSGTVEEGGATPENDDAASPEMPSTPPKTEGDTKSKDEDSSTQPKAEEGEKKKKKRKKKIPNPKLPTGTVLAVEPWKGIPGLARRVRWHRTGEEGIYRYGGDGGRYDIGHVEVNEKETRVRKRHPLPESAEQCAARYGFGVARTYNVILRLPRHGKRHEVDENEVEYRHEGLLEWPDFGAGVRVECRFHNDGAITITERELLFGSKDSGWEARFGQPSYVPGTVMVVSPTHTGEGEVSSAVDSCYEELLGSSSFLVKNLRNHSDNGGRLRVTSEMRLLRGRRGHIDEKPRNDSIPPLPSVPAPLPPPICFDPDCHASSISLSRDRRTVTCTSSDGRGTAFGNVGFTKGVHYWEVKLEKADIGSVFIGVAEKPGSPSGSSGSGASYGPESQPRLNRWLGWGFVNFRATYTAGAERVYGAHCHAGDTVGVLLDCDAGRISYFFDGVKYGEHILNDLGCAFENVSPFGFNADGCGSGGAGQGAPSGVEGGRGGRYPSNGAVRPRALWPVIGLRNPGDRVTVSSKWMTGFGVDGASVVKNVLAVDEVLCSYTEGSPMQEGANEASGNSHEGGAEHDLSLPAWFVKESHSEYERWRSGRWLRSYTRGSGPYPLASFGLDVDVDTSPLSCAAASASLGLKYALLSGDRVVVKRSAGRMLELSEEAVVLGAFQGRLFYRLVSQKSEGGSLTEGGGRAWFWDESEVVDHALLLVGEGLGLSVELPLLDRFKCTAKGGLRIVYNGGAVVRSDLEIFEQSVNIGTIPHGTVIPQKDVLERRMNSCGVVRYRVKYESVGEGWVSARIRGGKEEVIVEPVLEGDENEESAGADSVRVSTADDSARIWYEKYTKAARSQPKHLEHAWGDIATTSHLDDPAWSIEDAKEFESLLASGVIAGLSVMASDSLLASTVGAIADFSPTGDAVDCSFHEIASALSYAVKSHGENEDEVLPESEANEVPGANQAAAAALSSINAHLPPTKALLVRVAMLRALNRRVRMALPWISLRPAQEGSAILGGMSGFGASVERAGRSRNLDAMAGWVQAPSAAMRLRTCRQILFTSVKRSLLDSVMDATATPTPLSHDEYELPREVRTVRVNRLKARRAMASGDSVVTRKHSVFSQLQHEMRGWSGAALRRGFVAKGHGGQKRAFKVKLVGEGVNDYSGPYREVFTDSMQEVIELDTFGRGTLRVLDPSPNNTADIGDDRSLFVFAFSGEDSAQVGSINELTRDEKLIRNSFSSFIGGTNESSREVEDALVFLGKLCGTSCRHGIPVDLPLPLGLVWSRMTEEVVDPTEMLREVDLLASRQALEIDRESNKGEPLMPIALLIAQQRLLNSFSEGMGSIIPTELFACFTGRELRDVLCGNPDIDVELLHRVVEYEGYKESDAVIKYFWEILREMTSDERKLFLQFVWARTRLPMKESDFEAPFKIQRDTKEGGSGSPLPSASTCFFSLSLPDYKEKEILRQKLMFAITNVCTMESDYVTNDAEVGEGWRGIY